MFEANVNCEPVIYDTTIYKNIYFLTFFRSCIQNTHQAEYIWMGMTLLTVSQPSGCDKCQKQ